MTSRACRRCRRIIPADQTYCDACQPHNPKLVYRSARWRQLRMLILERDGDRCQRRSPGCTIHATQAGHLQPFTDQFDPLAYDPANLQAECAHCNRGEQATRHGTPAEQHPTTPEPWQPKIA